jgi:2-(1,2-epoxy-1,2-dihydrophenyl)acetyl-CoA isomerase
MVYRTLILEKDGPIATVILNRPDVGNSLSDQLNEEIDTVLRQINRQQDTRVVVITGAGRYFCTGVDLSMFASSESKATGHDKKQTSPPTSEQGLQDLDDDEVTWGKGTIVGAVVMIQSMSKPVIAAINGPVAGAGLSLALACDIRIASDRAKFTTAFVKRGLAPDTGGSFMLPRIVGFPKACELLFTGDTIDARDAEKIGLVNRVVPHDDLMATVRDLAGRIARNPPLAVAFTKKVLHQSMVETKIIDQIANEYYIQEKLLCTEDFQEATKAFLEKRQPIFKGK